MATTHTENVSEAVLSHWREQGYVLLKQAIPRDEAAAFLAAMGTEPEDPGPKKNPEPIEKRKSGDAGLVRADTRVVEGDRQRRADNDPVIAPAEQAAMRTGNNDPAAVFRRHQRNGIKTPDLRLAGRCIQAVARFGIGFRRRA